VVVAIFAIPSVGRGQVSRDAVAEALFGEGRDLMTAKNFALAERKFAASDEASPSVGARLSRGDCLKALSKPASAWASYKAAASLALQNGDRNRAGIAQTLADDIAPRVSYLQLEVPAPSRVSGLSISLDGQALEPSLWAGRLPVDPGSHNIKASGENHEAWESIAKVEEEGVTVNVVIPKLVELPEPATKEPVPAGPSPQANLTSTAEVSDAAPGRPWFRSPIFAIGVAGAGAAALAVGLGFGLSSRLVWNEAFDDGHCDEQTNLCSTRGQELTERSRTRATISNITVAGGLALVAGGAVLFFTAPSDDGESRDRTSLGPYAADGEVGLVFGGAF